ncbi:MAG: alpha-amylase family glycosyl hydrolase [Acholeplasmataceae bacterium]|nr:hypothetical protein [Acholeplasmataceae bacterium]
MKKLLHIILSIGLIVFLSSCSPKDSYEQLKKTNPQHDIYYQIFVRSFADSNDDGIGDLNGITENLDYLSDLGVTALWLLPIHPSPSYHGYDVMDYLDIHPEYGTMDDFERLLDAANDEGIKIVMDLVINHTSDQHPWYIDAQSSTSATYHDYYVWQNGNAYESFVGGMKDLNFENQDVIDEVESIMDFYLEKGVHGFRIDAAKHLIESTNPTFDNTFLLLELNQHIKENYPDSFIVSEVFEYFYPMVADYFIGSDSAFNFYAAQQIWDKVGKLNSRYLFVSNLHKVYETYRDINPDFIDSPFLTNHDLDRLASTPGFMNEPEKLALAARILLTLPGTPFIYYGEELGMKGYRDYSQDGQIIPGYGIAYDEFRRTPFLWGDDSKNTTWFPDLMNLETPTSADQKLDETSLFMAYKEIIALRKDNPALMFGNDFLPYGDNNGQIQGYIRSYQDENVKQAVIVIHNLSSDTYTLDIDFGNVIFGSKEMEAFATIIIEIDYEDIEVYA